MIVEKANRITATDSAKGAHAKADPKAAEVIGTPPVAPDAVAIRPASVST